MIICVVVVGIIFSRVSISVVADVCGVGIRSSRVRGNSIISRCIVGVMVIINMMMIIIEMLFVHIVVIIIIKSAIIVIMKIIGIAWIIYMVVFIIINIIIIIIILWRFGAIQGGTREL